QAVAYDRTGVRGPEQAVVALAEKRGDETLAHLALRLELREPLATLDLLADRGEHLPHDAVGRRLDAQLHLHRLDDEENIAAPHLLVRLRLRRDDDAGHRRRDLRGDRELDVTRPHGRVELVRLALQPDPTHRALARGGSGIRVDR